MKRLHVTLHHKPFLTVLWSPEGKLVPEYAPDELSSAVDRWNTCGILEWVREDPNDPASVEPRHTHVDSELFLFRLASYLERQFNVCCEVTDVSSGEVP